MDKAQIYQLLDEQGIEYEVTEHKAVFNMRELEEVRLPYPELDAKNLFVRDDKRQNYYLITVKGDKRVDLKDFHRKNGLRALTFASLEELEDRLGLTPGSVSPLGILNDAKRQVIFYLDAAFSGTRIGVHPNENTATVWLRSEDLLSLIRAHGNEVRWAEF